MIWELSYEFLPTFGIGYAINKFAFALRVEIIVCSFQCFNETPPFFVKTTDSVLQVSYVGNELSDHGVIFITH